jgi:hypothetical protein
MEQSSNFALPACGSASVAEPRLPRLVAAARSALGETAALRVDAAVSTLLALGRPRDEVSTLLPTHALPLTRRRVAKATVPTEAVDVTPDPSLTGRRVLVVGGDGLETQLVGCLQRLGLEAEWLSGFDNQASRMQGAQFDAVPLLTRRVSHAVADHAIRIGERGGATVVHVDTLGQTSLVEAAREALDGA